MRNEEHDNDRYNSELEATPTGDFPSGVFEYHLHNYDDSGGAPPEDIDQPDDAEAWFDDSDEFAVLCDPPAENVPGSQRRSYWALVFEKARSNPGQWIRTTRLFSKPSAAQLASDIRNAHRREHTKLRLRGFLPGDRFEAHWEATTTPDKYCVKLRYIGE